MKESSDVKNDGNRLNLRLKMITGETFPISINKYQTVHSLKRKIGDNSGIIFKKSKDDIDPGQIKQCWQNIEISNSSPYSTRGPIRQVNNHWHMQKFPIQTPVPFSTPIPLPRRQMIQTPHIVVPIPLRMPPPLCCATTVC